MGHNAFGIPVLSYFTSKNVFTGSRGLYNYKITPDEDLFVEVWWGRLCSKLATKEGEAHFPMTTEGHLAMLAWLEEQRQSHGT